MRLPIFATILGLVVPSFAMAQVSLAPVEGTNLTDGEVAAITVVLRDTYARVAQVQVMSAAETGGGGETLRCGAVRLAQKINLHCARLATDGETLYAADITAASLDDLVIAAERMARALATETPVELTRDHRTVTREESLARNRIFIEKVMGIKASTTAVLAEGVHYNPSLSLQFDGRLEAERYFLEFGAGLLLPATGDHRDYGALFAEIGGSRYLTDGDIAPYIGAGVSPRIIFDSVDGGIGVAPYVQAGLMLMRASSSRLYFDVRLSQNLTPLHKRDTYDWATDTSVSSTEIYPTEIGFLFGIGW